MGIIPVRDEALEAMCSLIRVRDIGIAEDVKLILVVMSEDGFDEVGDGVGTEVRREIPDLDFVICRGAIYCALPQVDTVPDHGSPSPMFFKDLFRRQIRKVI